ncbi:hypothetical protein SBDP1_910022 [Syntrophobacter sp. SbD1]|nr:hypothetical protein SBDP1_910022 [Syntrophobacter sp. SbD1]
MDDELLAQLKLLTNDSKGVPYQEFERILKHLLKEKEDISVSELNKVCDFACKQLGCWKAEWLFSPAGSPNNIAQTQTDGWRIFYEEIFDALVKEAQDVREALEGLRAKILLSHLIEQRIEYNETKPFKKLTTSVLSHMSFVFKRLGFHRIGRKLYERSLYPKGTVARP